MIAALQQVVNGARRRNRRTSDHLARRRHCINAPYPIRLYDEFLAAVAGQRATRIAPFDTPPPRQWERGLLIVRHDVDTAACVEGLSALLDVDRTRDVAAATFLRTDGVDYDPRSVVDTVRRYRKEPGLTFGLHTSCYRHDDFLKAFEDEVHRFKGVFGFVPDMFTVHGLGKARADVRRQFIDTIRLDLRKAGFSFSDCHPDFRRYDYVVEDCHLNPETGSRFVYDDILAAPGWIGRGESYLLLTHPCYWRKEA